MWRERSLSWRTIDCLKLCIRPEISLHTVSLTPRVTGGNTNSSWLPIAPWFCGCHSSIYFQTVVVGHRFNFRTRLSRSSPANCPPNSQVLPWFSCRAMNSYFPWLPTPLPPARESRECHSSLNQAFSAWPCMQYNSRLATRSPKAFPTSIPISK